MFSFVIKRLLQAILVMLIVTLIAFLLFQFVGDPVTQMLGQEATEADRLALTHELGLDQPIWKQFGAFIATIMSQASISTTTFAKLKAAKQVFKIVVT